MLRVKVSMPSINWQKRAVRRMPQEEIDSIRLPPPPARQSKINTIDVLANGLKQKEMRMTDMYSYMARMEKEIEGFHCRERTCREALFELKTAGKLNIRFCECGQATFYSWKK